MHSKDCSKKNIFFGGSYLREKDYNLDISQFKFFSALDCPEQAYHFMHQQLKADNNNNNALTHSLSGGLIAKVLKNHPKLLKNINNLIFWNSCGLSEKKFSPQEHKQRFLEYLINEILKLENPIFNLCFLFKALLKGYQDPSSAQAQLDFITQEKFYKYILDISKKINVLILISERDVAFPISPILKDLIKVVDSDHFGLSNHQEINRIINEFFQNNINNVEQNNYSSENIPNISEQDIQVWQLKFRDFYKLITGKENLILKDNYLIPNQSDQEGTESHIYFKNNQVLKVFKDYFPKPIQSIFAMYLGGKLENSKILGSKEMFEARKNDFDYLKKIIPKYLPEYKFEEKENNFQLQQEKINGITLQDFFDQFKNQESIQEYLQKKENLTLRNGLLDLIWASKKVFQITGGVYLDFFAKKDGLSNIIIKENTQEPFLVDPGLITFYASVLQVSNKILSAPVKENMQQEKEIQQYIEKLCNPSEQEKNILNLKYQIHNE